MCIPANKYAPVSQSVVPKLASRNLNSFSWHVYNLILFHGQKEPPLITQLSIVKDIIERSRVEVSLVEQDTVENVSYPIYIFFLI